MVNSLIKKYIIKVIIYINELDVIITIRFRTLNVSHTYIIG